MKWQEPRSTFLANVLCRRDGSKLGVYMDSVHDVLWSPIENKTSSAVNFYYAVLVLRSF